MNLTTEKNSLFLDGAKIFETPGKMEVVNVFSDSILVIYHPHCSAAYGTTTERSIPMKSEALWEEVSRNIFMIDKNGSVIWRIENFNYNNKADRYLYITFDNGKWYAYTVGGYMKVIDITSGNILDSTYSR